MSTAVAAAEGKAHDVRCSAETSTVTDDIFGIHARLADGHDRDSVDIDTRPFFFLVSGPVNFSLARCLCRHWHFHWYYNNVPGIFHVIFHTDLHF